MQQDVHTTGFVQHRHPGADAVARRASLFDAAVFNAHTFRYFNVARKAYIPEEGKVGLLVKEYGVPVAGTTALQLQLLYFLL